MTKDEALRMALEALEYHTAQTRPIAATEAAITAIKEALAQEQEPLTEWLICPKCKYKSPYSPLKAATLAADAERITKQTRAALAQREPDYKVTVMDDQHPEGIPLKQWEKPTERMWVGLTDDERAECWSSSAKQSAINIEALLKEKNHG